MPSRAESSMRQCPVTGWSPLASPGYAKRPGAWPWGPSKGASRRRGDTAGRDVWRAPDPRKASSSRLMALSSAVVVAVYAAGYGRTETAARQAAASLSAFAGSIAGAQANGAGASTTGGIAAPGSSSSAATPSAGPSPAPGASSSAANPSPATSSTTQPAAASGPAGSATASSAAAAAPAKSPAAAKYKDGTFSAQGWGPHGPMTVAVVVHLGRIVSANVTQCGTTYTCQYMDPLVRSVVSLQGPPVDYVSGATASSMAYYQAVTAALQKAH